MLAGFGLAERARLAVPRPRRRPPARGRSSSPCSTSTSRRSGPCSGAATYPDRTVPARGRRRMTDRPRAPARVRAGHPVHERRAVLPDGRRAVPGRMRPPRRHAGRITPGCSSRGAGSTRRSCRQPDRAAGRDALPAARPAAARRARAGPVVAPARAGRSSGRRAGSPGSACSPGSSTPGSTPRSSSGARSRAGRRPPPRSSTRPRAGRRSALRLSRAGRPARRLDRPPLPVLLLHERLALDVRRRERPRGRPRAGVRRPRGRAGRTAAGLVRLRRPRLQRRRAPPALGRSRTSASSATIR